jgi:2-dehydropantoate 2-reductase
MDEGLTVAVMGAGAVGCYYGGMLARAGHDVVLIARRNHVEAIERDGLRMETRSFDEHVRVRASTDPAAVRGADLVLFSVKSMDTEAAGRQVREHLDPAALVLCLQNGVDNADRLRGVLPRTRLPPASSTWRPRWRGPATCATTGGVSW